MRYLLITFLMPTLLFGSILPTAGYKKKTREEIEQEKIISRALDLEDLLNERVIGQEEAVQMTADSIIRFAAGVNDPRSPIATLLYCGPSGVGKTELAKQLAKALYHDDERFLRFNMSEYILDHHIQRLIGAPPGYVNHEQGGQLTNALKKYPYSVVLFDEVEKAHPTILKLFLQLFDEGMITSAKNEKVDARGCIFILTSNLAAAEIGLMSESGCSAPEILEEIEPYLMAALSVELYNRLDPVLFHSLKPEVKVSIVHKLLAELAARVAASRRLYLEFDESIVNYLVETGFDPLLGARPVKRLIEKELTPLVAKAIIRGDYQAGDHLLITLENGSLELIKN